MRRENDLKLRWNNDIPSGARQALLGEPQAQHAEVTPNVVGQAQHHHYRRNDAQEEHKQTHNKLVRSCSGNVNTVVTTIINAITQTDNMLRIRV